MNEQIRNIDIRRGLLEGLFEAERMRMSAEHFVNVVMPLSQENKLLVRALERVYSGIVLVINRVLQFECLLGRVKLYKDKEKNLRVFLKLAKGYGLSGGDLKMIKEILVFGKKHRESGMEFSRKKGFVILDDDLKHYKIDEKKVNEYIRAEENLFSCVKSALNVNFKGF